MKVQADIAEQNGTLELKALVIVPTLGWQNVGLSRVEYVMPPQDGLQDIIVSGTAPSGLVGQMEQTFLCRIGLPKADWLRGVRISDQAGNELVTLYTLVKGADPIGADQTFVTSAGLKGDKLMVLVSYGGGCRPHYFQLAWDGILEKSNPPRATFVLSHDANGDPCKALFRRWLQFDLSTALPAAAGVQIIVKSDDHEIIGNQPYGLLPPVELAGATGAGATGAGAAIGEASESTWEPGIPFPMKAGPEVPFPR